MTEILIRPLLAAFYPELNGIIQPLAGEFAARRKLLETLPYPTGYSIEIAHLLSVPPGALAQVDLEKRLHRNRPTDELGRMSFDLVHTFLLFLKQQGKLTDATVIGRELHQFPGGNGTPAVHVPGEIIRPPFANRTRE